MTNIVNKLYPSFSKKQLSGSTPKFYLTLCLLTIAYVPVLAQSEFVNINWGTATSQPYNVNEAQGEVVNGKLYSFGGFDSRKSCCTPTKRAYVYNPVANTWSAIADLPYIPNGANFGGVTHEVSLQTVLIFLLPVVTHQIQPGTDKSLVQNKSGNILYHKIPT